MPRYQAIIEFWALSDNHAHDDVRQAVQTIDALSASTRKMATEQGVGTGEVEAVSVLEVWPTDKNAHMETWDPEIDPAAPVGS